MLIVLLRERLLPWIDFFLKRPDRGVLLVDGQNVDVSQLHRRLDVSISWHTQDANSWRVSGQQIGPSINYEAAIFDPVKYQQTYSWSIVPWGADFTGLMVAFTSADDDLATQAKLELKKLGCGDLIVNEYSTTDVLNGKFRGLVFGRLKDDRGKGIWPSVCGENGSVLAFSRGGLPQSLMESNELVGTEDNPQLYGRGLCLRVKREDDFLDLARRDIELMVSDEPAGRYAACALKNFNSLQCDPLAFAIKEFSDAKVLYVPGTPRRHREIIVCRNTVDAKTIEDSERLRSSGMFELTCYC